MTITKTVNDAYVVNATSLTSNGARLDRFSATALSSATESATLHGYNRIATTVTTLNLPSISASDANSVVLVIRAAGGGSCAVTRADSDTIDGATTYTMDDTTPQAMFVVNAAGDGWEAWPRA